jgi:branched-chain amino acid transport system substrate-binding protein
MNGGTPKRSRAVALVALPALLVVAGCGTRLSDAAIEEHLPVTSAQQSTDPSVVGSVPIDSSNGAPGAQVPASVPGGTGPVASVAPGTVAQPGTTATKGGGNKGAGANTAPAGGQAGTAVVNQPCTRPLAPVIIGQDGSFSGLVGQAAGNLKLGMSVWVKWINAQGGLQCHPVQLFQEDDGSDPSKASANINDLVRNKHAIALVGTNVPVVVAAAQSTARQLKVPLVGGDTGAIDWYQDPNSFPSGGYPLAVYAGGIQQAVKDTGKTKISLIYCVEASTCGVINKNFAQMAAAAGATAVQQQSMSLTQSAYTAECKNAQNAGAEMMFISAEAATVQRVAKSCKGIGFNPIYIGIGLGASKGALEDPNVAAAGFYFGTSAVPFLATGLPALNTFAQAFRTYTGALAPDAPTMTGWAAGMLFKAAIDAVAAEARSGPITTEMVYQGLYSLKNQTLGGLLPPMNFVKDKTPPIVPCFGVIKASTSGLSAPTGNKMICNNKVQAPGASVQSSAESSYEDAGFRHIDPAAVRHRTMSVGR